MRKIVFAMIPLLFMLSSCALFTPNTDPNSILEWVTVPEVGTYYTIENLYNCEVIDTTTIKFVDSYEDSDIIVLTCETTSTSDTATDTTYLVINLVGQFVDYLTFYPVNNIGFTCFLVCPVIKGTHWEYSYMQEHTECEILDIDTIFNTVLGELKTIKVREYADNHYEISYFYIDRYFSLELCWNIYEKYDDGREKKIIEKGSWK